VAPNDGNGKLVIDVGGTIISNIHMDGVIPEPTLHVDGEKRI
jgi:2,5-dihydroxypyridine 5,6-dioxygenase